MGKKVFIIVVNEKQYQFTSKRKADKFFIEAFLSGKSVYELKNI